jgi:hypothetical protein
MSQPFTPLVAGSPALASGPKPSAAFSTLGHGHESGTNSSDTRPGVDATAGSVSATGTSSDGARVTLKREGDRITHVTIHCTCGQVLHLACSY